MRIVNICSNFVYSKLYYDFYQSMKEINQNITAYCPVRREGFKTALNYVNFEDEYIQNINKKITVSACFKNIDRFFFYHKRRLVYRDYIKKIGIGDDYIIAHSCMTDGYIAYKLHQKYHLEYTVFVQNTDINVFFKKFPFLRSLGKRIMLNATKVVFSSESVKKAFVEKYLLEDVDIINKICCIPFGVDNYYLENKGIPKKMGKELNVITVGSINKNKNQLAVCEALSKLVKDGYTVNYSLCGSIADKEEFQKIAQYSFVSYLGIKSKEELLPLYRENDIFILNSIHETFGLVYVEAMSQGLPILYSQNQGFDGQFDEGYVGYHITNLVEDIKKTIDNYERLSKNALEAVDSFSWRRIAEEYLK